MASECFFPGDLVTPSNGVARLWDRTDVVREALVLDRMYTGDQILIISNSNSVEYALVIANGLLGYVCLDRVKHVY